MEERTSDYEEQKILGDRNATVEYVQVVKAEFEGCMRKIFLEIAKKAFNREEKIADWVMEEAIRCWKNFFQSMKGGINLSEKDVKEAIRKEEKRQKRFYKALNTLMKKFKEKGFQVELIPPDRCRKNSNWDTGLTPECNIKVNNAYLCAFPLIPALTNYFVPSERGAAANVIFINRDCVLLQPYDQTLEEGFWKANEEMFFERDMKDEFPEADAAKLKNNFLFLVTDKIFSDAELKEMCGKYRVISIVKGDLSNSTAFIYTGTD